MVFSLTSLVILFVLVVGTAANIQELLKNCTENADCGKNANCRDFYQGCAQKGCGCDEGFVASSNKTDCIKVVKEGEACPDGGAECPEGTKCSTGVNPKCFPFIPPEESCPQDNRTCTQFANCKVGKCKCKNEYIAKGKTCVERLHNEECGSGLCYPDLGLKCINASCQCESGFRWVDYRKWQDFALGACIKIPGNLCTEDSDCKFVYTSIVNMMVCSNATSPSKCICDPVNNPVFIEELQLCTKNGSLMWNDLGNEHCTQFNPFEKLQLCNVNNDLKCKKCPGEGNSRCVSEPNKTNLSEHNKTNLSDCSEATRQYVPVVLMISLLTLKAL